jgi:succinoglycan biosynthesis protein ExoM
MRKDDQIDLAIIICTFRREQLLRKALSSLITQSCPDGLSVTVFVVDNSDEGSAAGVVELASRESPFEIHRVEAHPPNISVARNAGLRAAAAPYVAFIDDDEELEPGWLDAVAQGVRVHPHDVLLGAVVPVFEAPERASNAVDRLFSRRLDAVAGQDLFAFGSKKTSAIAMGTGNSIFRRATTLDVDGPFGLDHGKSGGEDYDLFCRLQLRGCRFGWLPAARVREFVPASRCDPAYLRRRFYAGGQHFAEAVAGVSRRPATARWWLRAKAAAQAVALAAAAPLHACRGRNALLDHSYRFAGVLGKLSLGALYPLYHQERSG